MTIERNLVLVAASDPSHAGVVDWWTQDATSPASKGQILRPSGSTTFATTPTRLIAASTLQHAYLLSVRYAQPSGEVIEVCEIVGETCGSIGKGVPASIGDELYVVEDAHSIAVLVIPATGCRGSLFRIDDGDRDGDSRLTTVGHVSLGEDSKYLRCTRIEHVQTAQVNTAQIAIAYSSIASQPKREAISTSSNLMFVDVRNAKGFHQQIYSASVMLNIDAGQNIRNDETFVSIAYSQVGNTKVQVRALVVATAHSDVTAKSLAAGLQRQFTGGTLLVSQYCSKDQFQWVDHTPTGDVGVCDGSPLWLRAPGEQVDSSRAPVTLNAAEYIFAGTTADPLGAADAYRLEVTPAGAVNGIIGGQLLAFEPNEIPAVMNPTATDTNTVLTTNARELEIFNSGGTISLGTNGSKEEPRTIARGLDAGTTISHISLVGDWAALELASPTGEKTIWAGSTSSGNGASIAEAPDTQLVAGCLESSGAEFLLFGSRRVGAVRVSGRGSSISVATDATKPLNFDATPLGSCVAIKSGGAAALSLRESGGEIALGLVTSQGTWTAARSVRLPTCWQDIEPLVGDAPTAGALIVAPCGAVDSSRIVTVQPNGDVIQDRIIPGVTAISAVRSLATGCVLGGQGNADGRRSYFVATLCKGKS